MLAVSVLQEAMCVHHKADPKLLPKLPLFGPEGEVMTNGISSPCHLTPSYDGEQSEQMQVTLTELKEAKSLSVDEVVILSTVDSKHMCLGLVKEYQIELERIDQQLLELGPYAQDAYDDDEPQLETVQLFVSPPPPEVRRGKKGKPPAPHKASRRPPKGVDDFQDTQRGGWRALGGGWTEVSDRKSDDKDLPKKKWRKVGSAGPTMRGKEGQLDAQSDPLNVSSANIIVTPLSDLERRAFYQSPQESKRKSTPGDGDGGESMSTVHVAQMLDHQGIQTGDGACGHPNDFSISTTAHSTPSCNTTSPLDSHGHFRTQPTAQWKPISGGQDLPHPLQEGYAHHTPSYAHLPQQVQMDTSGTSEEVDVTRVEGEESPKLQLAAAAEARQSEGQTLDSHSGYENHLPPQARRDSHGPKPGHQLGTFIGQSDSQQTHSPSPKTTIPGYRPAETVVNSYSLSQHQPPTGGIPKPPGFSISHLTEFSAQSPVHDAHSYMDSTRGPSNSGLPGECSVVSPHGEVGLRKRRSSSSSSYRSTRQQSVDDTAAARSGSPLSACHPRGQYMPGIIWDGGTVIPSPNTKDKVMSSDGKVPGMIPFSMWPPGMPIPTEGGIPGQVQRYPLSSPFLAASHPWLRGGMISGLPFRPALYPTGAAASIDPSNPYKSMLGLPLYPFPPTGLKGPFPTPAFTSPSSAPNSQPQTPSSISSTPGFPFGQYPMTQGMGANALREAQSRLPGGSPQLVQHPSFAVGKDSKQRGSPETNQDMPQQQPWSMIPGMSMLQAPFGFGVQNPLSSSVSQAPPLNFLPPRGPIPFSTSPLTLATQSIVAGASGSDIQHSAMEAYHQAALAGRWSKKQSSSSIDLTREQVVKHIEAPSPQEAVKMATQRISPFQDTSRFSPKLKSVQEAAATPPSSSSLVPSTQAQGPVLSYPMLSAPGGVGNGAIGMPGHIINPSQLMGVALSGSHMIPMNYQAIQNLSGKVEDGVGKKRSPKRGGGTQKLRIHQMDFKNQGKVDRRRRRPWKLQEKPQEESNVVVSTKPAESTQSRVVSTEEPSSSVQAPSEDNYALNMLADCSSKEGEKTKPVQVTAAPQQTQELTAKRTLMRSPGSIAGANSLLLLAKPDTVSSAGSTGQRASPPENAVVDSLLELSKPSISSSSAAQDPSESRPASESGTQSTAAEAILMIGHGGLDSKGDTKEGKKSPISEKVNEGKEKGDVDSEKTDTDSEATLSPTSPALTSTATCRWPQGAPKTQAGEEKVQSSTSQELTQEFVKPTVAPARRALDVVQTILKNGESPSQASNYSEAPSLSSPVATTSEETPRETTPPAYPAVKTSAIPSPPAEQVSPALESVLNGVGENIAEKPPPPSDQEKNEAVVVTSEMQLLTEAKEKRELLDFGPPSSRLEMIDDEEDADVDVENIDSSLLDEPDPVINSPQSSKSPVLTSPSNALETQPSVLPEVVPSPPPQGSASPIMPSPHPQLQDLADSPCKEPVKEDTVNRVEEKMQHEEEPLVQTIEDSEPQPDTDAPLPKRPRVEESEEQVGKMESEENQLDEVMDTETPRSPAVGNTSSPSPKIITPVSPSSRVAMTDITPEPCPSPLPSAADVKESEEATKSVKDEVKLTTAENVESSNSRSRSGLGNSPVEPLSPANFTDKQAAVTSETDDKEVPLFEGAVSQDAEVAGEPVQLLGTTAPTQEEKSSEETNHDAAVSDAADGPSACILWPAEPDEQVPAEMNASSVQKSITPTSPASPSTNYSDDCKQPNAPTKTHSRSPSPVAGENIAAASMQTSQKNPNHVQESRCPQLSPEAYQVEKTTKSMKTESNVDPLQAPSRISPPVAPQNRLPVGKSGFDRHQQHRKLMSQQHAHKQHSRDEKNLQSKKWPRMQDPGSRARGLFDVDPQESRRQKTDNRTSEREPVKHPSEGRKVKPRLLPPTHGHSNKQSTERAKYNNRPPRSSEDQPHRHSRPQDGSQGSTWEQGKQKVRPPGRQGPRFSPLPPHLTEHSPGHPKDHDEVPCISDEEQTRGGRVRVGHQNSHGWREGHQPPTDHTRDRGYVLNKLKGGHRTDSKQGFEQGRKIVRIEKEKDQRKHMSTVEANTDERAPVFKRHREEDTDHTSSARLKLSGTRKRSYESVSEDELPEDSNRSSSRESSLVAEDRTRSERRSSLEAAEQRSSAWRKEQKITPDGSDDTEEFSRISKHKKHKHGSKERKERRKWRKTTDGNDQKLKRSSEDKMWLSYHKH